MPSTKSERREAKRVKRKQMATHGRDSLRVIQEQIMKRGRSGR